MVKRVRADLCLVCCGVLVWLLADAAQTRAAAEEALSLCGRSVVPALFPFLVVTSLLISLGFGAWLSPCLSGLMTPLFRLPGCAGSALLLGLTGGYPIGAKTVADLHRDGLLTAGEASRALSFCNNANPVFLISVLGSGVFGSVRTGIWLWLIHVFSALLTGLCLRGGKEADRRRVPAAGMLTCRAVSLPAALVSAVRESAAGMLSVCAFVVLFYVLAHPFTAIGGLWGAALTGGLELFSLTPLLTADRAGFVLASGCAGWGGLSVLCQTAAVLDGSGISVRSCVLGKAMQGLFSGLLAWLLAGYVLG